MVKRSVRSSTEKRVPVSTKVLPSVRSMLMDAADAANRTLGAEIEYRLAQSFKAQDTDDLRQIIREEVGQSLASRGLLSDPAAVHINMLRGVIAKPTVDSILHLYGEKAFRDALSERDKQRAMGGNHSHTIGPARNGFSVHFDDRKWVV